MRKQATLKHSKKQAKWYLVNGRYLYDGLTGEHYEQLPGGKWFNWSLLKVPAHPLVRFPSGGWIGDHTKRGKVTIEACDASGNPTA